MPGGWAPPPSPLVPQHPRATTALVLGIVSIVGAFVCVLPILVAPFAWVIGGRATRDIDAQPGRWRGRELAEAGRVLGIVGTCLLVAGLALFAAWLTWVSVAFGAPSYFW